MKWGFVFIIVLWSFSSYGGGFSFFRSIVKRSCTMGFLNPLSRQVEGVRENQKETLFPFFLLIVRHASYEMVSKEAALKQPSAEIRGSSDNRLRLSKEGKEKFIEICKARNFCSFDLLLHSSSMRAWETADIFSEQFTVRERRKSDHLSLRYPNPEDILQEIRTSQANTVVLVGHQPSLRQFLFRVLDEESAKQVNLLLTNYGDMVPLRFSSWDLGSAKMGL